MISFSELKETFRQVFESLRSNGLRSLLSALGVVIGITVVILMGYALNGLDQAINKTFESIGTDMIFIDKYEWAGGRKRSERKQRKAITFKQADRFCRKVQTAELAVPLVTKWSAQIKYENKNINGVMLRGTYPDYAYTSSGQIDKGRFFSAAENFRSENVAIIGAKVSEALFKNLNPIGKHVKIGGHKFLIVGVAKKQGSLFFDLADNSVVIPLNTFRDLFGRFRRNFSIAVKAGSEERLDIVKSEAVGLMREIRNLKPGDENDFAVNETKTFQSMVDEITIYIWIVGLGMTFLSFLVGSIGVMNIMFVSVAERVKEIGIRKALGAKKILILFQFITESVFICLLGSIVSYMISQIIIFIIASIIPQMNPDIDFLSPLMPWNLFWLPTALSFVVGILAGFFPALRASSLDPVEALRHE